MKHPYQIGVIGAGARAETFTRQLGTGRQPGAELFGICDIDEDRLRKYCEYCGHTDVRRFTDPNKFLRQRNMDAVLITTPEFTHREVAVAAIQAGKHIYLEKAMAHTSEDCRAIIRAHERSRVIAFLGFNLRETNYFRGIKKIVDSGMLGRLIHISALEQLSVPHSASFMRRFHRHSSRSGGFLNTKCSHDLDMMQALVGHDHRVVKVASFGGTNVFRPENAPVGHGEFCHECPPAIYQACPYKDQAGFTFPVKGKRPIHKTKQLEIYGGDLCVYNTDKDIVDGQSTIFEWDHGVRGNFNLQLFQNQGLRAIQIWGEKGTLEVDTVTKVVLVTRSDTGEMLKHDVAPSRGGHGGSDSRMLQRFIQAIDSGKQPSSGLYAGLAATLLAEKADLSRTTGRVVEILPQEYTAAGTNRARA